MAARVAPSMVAPTDDELLLAQADLWRHSLYYVTSKGFQCAIKLGIPTAIHRAGGASSLRAAAGGGPPGPPQPLLRHVQGVPVRHQARHTHRHPPRRGRLVASRPRRRAVPPAGQAPVLPPPHAAAGLHGRLRHRRDHRGRRGVFRLTPLSWLLVEGAAPMVDSHPCQVPVALAATSRHCVEAAMGLAEWFRKEAAPSAPAPPSPFEEAHGAALFEESMAELDPESDAMFNEGLAAHDHSGFATVLRECSGVFQGLQSLTAGRGGDGTATRAIVEAFPGIKCTVLDLPRVIGEKRADGAVSYVPGDMFLSIPPAQAVMLKLVLHHYNDEDCVKILAQCKKAVPSREAGGKVIIVDIAIGAPAGPLLEAQLLMDVAMMVVTKGRQRDEDDWRVLFGKAGFSDYKIVKKLGARAVFEAYPYQVLPNTTLICGFCL
uniref:O-methyltransferase C-terminal domain-containing protein n=1 Tax=Oryza brachyantha TaxID=4533 RepID=J3N7N8_ORYBR